MHAYLYNLGVARVPCAHILIGGILWYPLAVPNLRGHNPRDALEEELWAPETSGSKGGALQMGSLRPVHARSLLMHHSWQCLAGWNATLCLCQMIAHLCHIEQLHFKGQVFPSQWRIEVQLEGI